MSNRADIPAAYADVKGLAQYSGLSKRTLETWLAHSDRPIPHFRLGENGRGKRLVRLADFDRWLEQWKTEGPVKRRVDEIMGELATSCNRA